MIQPKISRFVSIGLAAALALGSAAAASPESPPASPPTSAAPGTLSATLRGVDSQAKEIQVISGVGYALRVIRIPVAEGCSIRVSGSVARLEDLRPGALLRIRTSGAGAQIAAQEIETVAPPAVAPPAAAPPAAAAPPTGGTP